MPQNKAIKTQEGARDTVRLKVAEAASFLRPNSASAKKKKKEKKEQAKMR